MEVYKRGQQISIPTPRLQVRGPLHSGVRMLERSLAQGVYFASGPISTPPSAGFPSPSLPHPYEPELLWHSLAVRVHRWPGRRCRLQSKGNLRPLENYNGSAKPRTAADCQRPPGATNLTIYVPTCPPGCRGSRSASRSRTRRSPQLAPGAHLRRRSFFPRVQIVCRSANSRAGDGA
jgi:hypothetical protein